MTQILSHQHIADVVVTAFEGGSSYWCSDAIDESAYTPSPGAAPWYNDPKYWATDFRIRVVHDGPTSSEGARDVETIVTPARLHAGLTLAQKRHPELLSAVRSDQYDCETADCLWQLVVLEEILFG
jgi:hypothetical protein